MFYEIHRKLFIVVICKMPYKISPENKSSYLLNNSIPEEAAASADFFFQI